MSLKNQILFLNFFYELLFLHKQGCMVPSGELPVPFPVITPGKEIRCHAGKQKQLNQSRQFSRFHQGGSLSDLPYHG